MHEDIAIHALDNFAVSFQVEFDRNCALSGVDETSRQPFIRNHASASNSYAEPRPHPACSGCVKSANNLFDDHSAMAEATTTSSKTATHALNSPDRKLSSHSFGMLRQARVRNDDDRRAVQCPWKLLVAVSISTFM